MNFLLGFAQALRAYRASYLANQRNSRNNKQVINRLLTSGIIKLELGSHIPRKNWSTLDLLPGADIIADLTQRIPFPDNTVDEIYCSHFLEHFTMRDLHKILKECFRALKNGGKLSICVPDASIYLNGYCNASGFNWDTYIPEDFKEYRTNNRIDIVNFVAYLYGNHKHMFDQEGLIYNLRQAGFSNVAQREFNPHLDKEERHFQSIYAIAVK